MRGTRGTGPAFLGGFCLPLRPISVAQSGRMRRRGRAMPPPSSGGCCLRAISLPSVGVRFRVMLALPSCGVCAPPSDCACRCRTARESGGGAIEIGPRWLGRGARLEVTMCDAYAVEVVHCCRHLRTSGGGLGGYALQHAGRWMQLESTLRCPCGVGRTARQWWS